MKKYTAGFIGCGNMGGTLACACAAKAGGNNIAVFDIDTEKSRRISDGYGAVCTDLNELVSSSKFIFLGVKPQVMKEVISGFRDELKKTDGYTVVSMAAGLDIAYIRECMGFDCPVIRIMPNTPCFIGRGMILISPADSIPERDTEELTQLLCGAGMTDRIPEKLIDAASAVSGCGPAYAYMFIEAMADAGVECGLPRQKAYIYASQMLFGSAGMVLEKGGCPAALKDDVCSPGGTTIAGVHALEHGGFRASVMDAVTAAYEKTLKLKK